MDWGCSDPPAWVCVSSAELTHEFLQILEKTPSRLKRIRNWRVRNLDAGCDSFGDRNAGQQGREVCVDLGYCELLVVLKFICCELTCTELWFSSCISSPASSRGWEFSHKEGWEQIGSVCKDDLALSW